MGKKKQDKKLPEQLYRKIFEELKVIQIRYSKSATDAWETFLSAPTLDFVHQFELQQWASENMDFDTTAKLFQMMEATDSVRFNSQAVKEILLFTEKMTKYPVNSEVKRKMIHISMSVLEMLSSDSMENDEEDREAQLRRDNAFAAHCIGTLLHFGEYEPLTRFIKDRAVNPRGMRITESMLNKCMAQAVQYKITGLADACLFHEKYRPTQKLDQKHKEDYTAFVESNELLLAN